MDPRTVFALVLIAVSFIVAVTAYSHDNVVSSAYASTQLSLHDGSVPTVAWALETGPGSKFLTSLARESVDWSRRSVVESYVWAGVLLVVGVVFFVRSK